MYARTTRLDLELANDEPTITLQIKFNSMKGEINRENAKKYFKVFEELVEKIISDKI